MDLRIKDLASLDPLAVPLPNGTEVSTRVDRVLPDRRVPQGAVGRVVGRVGEREFDVHVVGVGVVRFARDELVPRKVGQARFAQRRAASWDALRPCAVIEATVGSRAWGLSDAGSDTDLRGAFALPFAWTTGLAEPPTDLVSTDGSSTYWEVGKAVRQALRADPNTLEMLFVRNVRPLDAIGEWLIAEREAFVSREIYGSFGRYALSQLNKLVQSLRLAEHRTAVLEWLREPTPPGLDEVARRLAAISPRAAPTAADAHARAKEYLKQLYRSMHDQGLIAANDFASLVAYARRDDGGAVDLPRELRPKNAYNLLRLIATATHWLTTGTPEFEIRGPLRERLLAIKKGHVALEEVVREAEALTPALDAARESTCLPRRPDVARADALVRRITEELARRWAVAAPGPWGRDAPAPPPVTWDDEP